jgi:hypothetical protein
MLFFFIPESQVLKEYHLFLGILSVSVNSFLINSTLSKCSCTYGSRTLNRLMPATLSGVRILSSIISSILSLSTDDAETLRQQAYE